MRKADAERLPAAHRETGDGAHLRTAVNTIGALHHRDYLFQQIAREKLAVWVRWNGTEADAGLRVSERHDHDHRHRLAICDQVIEDHVGAAGPDPSALVI